MITAEEARKLAGPTIEEQVAEGLDYADKQIRAAATEKRRNVRLDKDPWVYGGYGNTEVFKLAKAALEEKNFKVSFKYEERQFVDMYTLVEW